MIPPHWDDRAEWLEADGLGGFASGTAAGIRTRRYHALLLAATTPPTGRVVLVNGFDAWVDTPAGSFPISSQSYPPGIVAPDGVRRIESFEADPWPRCTFRLEDGTRVAQEIFVAKASGGAAGGAARGGRAIAGAPKVAVTWRLLGAAPGRTGNGRAGKKRPEATLWLRPFLSARDFHSLHHENAALRFEAEVSAGRVAWQPYDSQPRIVALTNGRYAHEPDWYRNFYYRTERERGLDCLEDLASPGVFRWDLSRGEAIWILAAEDAVGVPSGASEGGVRGVADSPAKTLARLRAAERRRRAAFAARLDRAADAFLVRRGAGLTIIAGYPWFADWGRDTFIALRGLCLATGRAAEARAILLEWADAISEGMIPNRFPDRDGAPEFNSVDASLWFVVAVHDLLRSTGGGRAAVSPRDRSRLTAAVEQILEAYSRGARHGIRADADGLLAAGEPGVQLTWMDAKVGDRVVTPRIGKPVEVQALWLNALRIGADLLDGARGERARRRDEWRALHDRGLASFRARFWNEAVGGLHDVVDVDRVAGRVDSAVRPNQIFAVGGLPYALFEGDRARAVVDLVEARLLTPLGLRTLEPGAPGYAGRYDGPPSARDAAYHNGTAWPWLLGAFVEAWVRVRAGSAAAKREARARFLAPLLAGLDDDGIGHLPEIADGDPPHAPRGCPFQAWSLAEAIRLDRTVL